MFFFFANLQYSAGSGCPKKISKPKTTPSSVPGASTRVFGIALFVRFVTRHSLFLTLSSRGPIPLCCPSNEDLLERAHQAPHVGLAVVDVRADTQHPGAAANKQPVLIEQAAGGGCGVDAVW